jgi:hypothetical protein
MSAQDHIPTEEERAILRTVVYSALFEYPLTLDELWQGLLESRQDRSELMSTYRGSRFLQSRIDYREGFFFLAGQGELIALRRERERTSRARLRAFEPILRLICMIPHTRLVALSGSAAHLNMDEDSDFDLFIVTRGARVWSVAVTILLLTRLLGCRRQVCFNFVVADTRLSVEPRDLFTANQIIHLRPLVGARVFRRFVRANPFVAAYYPNFRPEEPGISEEPRKRSTPPKVLAEALLRPGLGWLQEWICRVVYRRYLRFRAVSWMSPEDVVLERDYLKLHTHSHRLMVLDRFREAMSQCLEGEADLRRRSRYGSRGGAAALGNG